MATLSKTGIIALFLKGETRLNFVHVHTFTFAFFILSRKGRGGESHKDLVTFCHITYFLSSSIYARKNYDEKVETILILLIFPLFLFFSFPFIRILFPGVYFLSF